MPAPTTPLEHAFVPSTSIMAPSSASIAEQLTAHAARLFGFQLSAEALPVGPLPDAKKTFVLRGPGGKPVAVAQCSSPLAPDMVARGVDRADEVRDALEPAQQSVVLHAIARGTIDGISYAIWPYRHPLSARGTRFIARRALVNPVLSFLRALARDTQRPALREVRDVTIDSALCAQACDVRLPARARLAARDALRRIDRGVFRPINVAAHGDLHLGNILLDVAEAPHFVLIDWCGASTQGWPLLDLMRASESLQISNARLRVELEAHCALLEASRETNPLEDAPTHLTLALAHLGSQLEHFSFERYAQLVDRMYARLDAATQSAHALSGTTGLVKLQGHLA